MPPPETAGESQRHNDSDGVSESENKGQEKILKVMCSMDSKKITPNASSGSPPTPTALLTPCYQPQEHWWKGRDPDCCSRAARSFLGMSLKELCPNPKILYVCQRAAAVTSRLSLWVTGNLHVCGSCKLRGPKIKLNTNLYHKKLLN